MLHNQQSIIHNNFGKQFFSSDTMMKDNHNSGQNKSSNNKCDFHCDKTDEMNLHLTTQLTRSMTTSSSEYGDSSPEKNEWKELCNNRTDDIYQSQDYQELLNERNGAIQESQLVHEKLSHVMEVVQILTRQMKRSRYDKLNSYPHERKRNESVKMTPASYISSVYSVDSDHSETDTEAVDKNNIDYNYSNEKSLDDKQNAHKHYLDDKDESQNTLDRDNRHGQNKGTTTNTASVTTSVVNEILTHEDSMGLELGPSLSFASYTNDDNNRLSELLELSSSSSTTRVAATNSPPCASSTLQMQHPNLSKITSDLIALSHSCQMVVETAFWLHHEGLTFLTDLQETNLKLKQMQSKHRNTRRLAKRVYNENLILRHEIDKQETEKKLLVKELKKLMNENKKRKGFEKLVMGAMNVHEKIMAEAEPFNESTVKENSLIDSTTTLPTIKEPTITETMMKPHKASILLDTTKDHTNITVSGDVKIPVFDITVDNIDSSKKETTEITTSDNGDNNLSRENKPSTRKESNFFPMFASFGKYASEEKDRSASGSKRIITEAKTSKTKTKNVSTSDSLAELQELIYDM